MLVAYHCSGLTWTPYKHMSHLNHCLQLTQPTRHSKLMMWNFAATANAMVMAAITCKRTFYQAFDIIIQIEQWHRMDRTSLQVRVCVSIAQTSFAATHSST